MAARPKVLLTRRWPEAVERHLAERYELTVNEADQPMGPDALAEAFHALTPGRRKSYMFALNQAKQTATRVARIEKFRDRIIAGKGALER